MTDTHVVILAAGQGTRMKSALPKVLHPVAGRPMVEHVVRTANSLSPATMTVIVGHQADAVQALLGGREGIQFALQAPQLGTAHALQQAEPLLAGRTGTVVLLSGDVPLLKAATLRRLLETHLTAKAAATVVTASSNALTATAASSGSAAGSPGSSRSATPRRRSGASRKSTAASTRSTWPRCSTRCEPSPPRTRRASTT